MAPTSIRVPATSDTEWGLILAIYACEAVIPAELHPEPNMQIIWCDENDAIEKLIDYPLELRDAIRHYLENLEAVRSS
jgi:hypothetical protein